MKKLLFILLIMVLVVGCSTQPAEESNGEEGMETEMQEFTLEEIEEYNGNGAAYIVIDGDVYDVTDVPQWEGGMHQGFTAGNDFSEEIVDAPHGKSVLENLKKVGTIVEE